MIVMAVSMIDIADHRVTYTCAMASQLMLSSRLWAQFQHTVPCRRIASDGERLLQSRARYPVGERGLWALFFIVQCSLDNAACPEVSPDDGMIDFTDLPILE